MLSLPECEPYAPLSLTPAQVARLEELLLARGADGLTDFLQREVEAGNLRRVFQEELALVDIPNVDAEGREADWRARWTAREADVESELGNLRRRLDGFDVETRALTSSPMLTRLRRPAKRSRWARFWAWLRRLWRRFWTWLRRRRRSRPRTAPIGIDAGRALDDREFQLWMADQRGERPPSAVRRWWQRNFHRSTYRRLAQEALKQEAREARDRARNERRELRREFRDAEQVSEDLYKRRDRSWEQEQQRIERDREQLAEQRRSLARQALQERVARLTLQAGLLEREGEGMVVSEGLLRGLASRLFTELVEELNLPGPLTGLSSDDTGTYQRRPLMSHHEVSRLDIVASLVEARQHGHTHLEERDLVIHAEEKLTRVHAVLCVDISGSMDEHGRLPAAKRALLSLYGAITAENPDNRVDVVAISTGPRIVGLRELWGLEAQGFTNTGGALFLAAQLFREHRADRRLLYLITDGLPEAWSEGEENRAGDFDRAREFALEGLAANHRLDHLRFAMVLLEPDDPAHVEPARELARAGGARLAVTRPDRLAEQLVVDYLGL